MLAHEGQRHSLFTTSKMVSRIGHLVLQARRPHKVAEIMVSTEVDKEILAPAFMQISKTNNQVGR